ncbi:15926_t:CDS:2 [Cetraspora pellucida]|uniref:15926_t:CDS:1 n=1 Tax=Cetraspora pellucida TaxID=1433469 RepID=A0A9N9IQQ3_9GLOM|nr:15926_t:CDS:2 [Cetraspora pellucida]
MVKTIRQLDTTYLGYTAHTIHLAVTDGLKKFLELAKSLVNNPDHTIRADGNSLNEKMLTNEKWTGSDSN